jgi:hypothetical protein
MNAAVQVMVNLAAATGNKRCSFRDRVIPRDERFQKISRAGALLENSMLCRSDPRRFCPFSASLSGRLMTPSAYSSQDSDRTFWTTVPRHRPVTR